MTKVCVRWVPQMFDHKMKVCRCKASNENLKLIQLNWNLFIRRIVTGDETWLHDCDPETTKQQTMQWKHASSPNPLKFKMQASSGKIMCTVFWGAEDILPIDYMPHKVTITGAYNVDLLCKLLITSKEKRQGKLTQVPVVLHNNAPVHSHILDRLLYLNGV